MVVINNKGKMVHEIFDYSDVIIECGSREFVLQTSDILFYPESFLCKIITQVNPLVDKYPMHNGRRVIKLDRDPNIFELVAEYYRKHKVYVPYNMPYERVYDEFDYFCLPIDTDLRVFNIGIRWKNVNKPIQFMEEVVEMLVFSDWFHEQMENSLTFIWHIGHGSKLVPSYNIFGKNELRELIPLCLKKRYNINCIITTSSVNVSKDFNIRYFIPNDGEKIYSTYELYSSSNIPITILYTLKFIIDYAGH